MNVLIGMNFYVDESVVCDAGRFCLWQHYIVVDYVNFLLKYNEVRFSHYILAMLKKINQIIA